MYKCMLAPCSCNQLTFGAHNASSDLLQCLLLYCQHLPRPLAYGPRYTLKPWQGWVLTQWGYNCFVLSFRAIKGVQLTGKMYQSNCLGKQLANGTLLRLTTA